MWCLAVIIGKIFKNFLLKVTFKSHENRDENDCRRSLYTPLI